jgi:hypothetical protein
LAALFELYVIYSGLFLAIDMSIDELVCYSDSLHRVNLIKSLQVRYHIHVVLIQDINKFLKQMFLSITYLERGKLGTSSDAVFLTHTSSPEDIRDLLRNDATETLFLRE